MKRPAPAAPALAPALSKCLLTSAQAVLDVLQGRSLSDALATVPGPLRAPVQAISFHAMRRLGLVCAVRNCLVPRTPPKPLLDTLLLVSLAVLDAALYSEQAAADPSLTPLHPSVPVYAVHTVVDQAVRAASRDGLVPWKGLVNACLRRFVREHATLLPQVLKQPEALYNFPDWWIRQVRQAYPHQWQAVLQASNLPGPMVLRVNRRRTTLPALLAAFSGQGIQVTVAGGDALVLQSPRPVHDLPGFSEGWWSVQDLAAQQAALLLPVHDGQRVLDACAAPGGKTAHLLERHALELIALDSDPVRLGRVAENLERLGLSGPTVQLTCADAARLGDWWDGRPFDAILADVPCTASGVVRRHPDIRWLRRESDIAQTAALQRNLIDALWKTLRPGGHLLYATCSIFPQECELQAQAFVQRHPDAQRLQAPGQLLPLSLPGASTLATDGFFYALFVKAPEVVDNCA